MNKITILNQVMKGFFLSLFLYISLFFLFDALPMFFQRQGVLHNILSAPEWVKLKAKEASVLMEESHLALNFIGNIRKLDFEEAKAFQSSGLMHLLAISGGQVVPLANLFSGLLGYFLYYVLRKKQNSGKTMLIISQSKTCLSLFLSFFICYIFACSGALLRTSVFSYLAKIKLIRFQHSILYSIEPYINSTTSMRIIILVFVTFSFGNIFLNYSFLLSAIGASCAELSSIFSYYFFKKSFFLRSLGITVLTSVFVGCILSPFMAANILDSCMANIIALPVVGFLMAPLSLLALFIPSSFFLFPYILQVLDLSFWLFRKIAFTFYAPYSGVNPFSRVNPLFTEEGSLYLSGILIFLWVVIDLYRERKIFVARSLFSDL